VSGTIVNGTEDVRKLISEVCDSGGISGYALERDISDKGYSNASGSRHFVSGRQPNVTLDTFFTLCHHLGLRVEIERPTKKKVKPEDRKEWSWEERSQAESHFEKALRKKWEAEHAS
tara:strand:- start:937 stop:1287 length:351 start_codon:yes stop_codon:yes gene_type:complete